VHDNDEYPDEIDVAEHRADTSDSFGLMMDDGGGGNSVNI